MSLENFRQSKAVRTDTPVTNRSQRIRTAIRRMFIHFDKPEPHNLDAIVDAFCDSTRDYYIEFVINAIYNLTKISAAPFKPNFLKNYLDNIEKYKNETCECSNGFVSKFGCSQLFACRECQRGHNVAKKYALEFATA